MTAAFSEPKPVAAVITEWWAKSHADVMLSRLLEPEAWGHTRPFGIKLVSVYADNFPPNDLCRSYCAKHGVPIFETVMGAVGVGTKSVPVEGVLIIGEHGRYLMNPRRQPAWPRRRFFDEVVHAFRMLGRRVPVFSDKHLSYEWPFARWMVELARHEGIPFMAGSSLPLTWRVPPLSLPIGTELDQAFALGYGDPEGYGIHAVETLQCMTERRKGGETGVSSVRCLTGPAAWEGAEQGLWPSALVDALMPARLLQNPNARPLIPRERDTVFLIRYRDGLKAAVGMLGSAYRCFAFAARLRGVAEPVSTVFALEEDRPNGHFGYLVRAIEAMILTGRPSYPVERTLMTSGLLAALMQSRAEGGAEIRTPHLAEVTYQPADWPFATGPVGTPA
jgi:hypothetical protein